MSRTHKFAERFLNKLQRESTQETFEILELLTEELENKNDPDPAEIQLVESIYLFIEKMKVMEGSIKKYVNEERSNLPGNKLSALYEDLNNEIERDED
jgi:hypothetical protein